MLTDVALPLLALALAGWLVPWGLGGILPEGVGWLVVNGALSTLVLIAAAAIGFGWLYGAAAGAIWREAPFYFLVLSLRSALVWGPVMALSLANLPRGWTTTTW